MTSRTVFLSSTTKDLKDYRDAAYEAIEGLDGYHCIRMENFGARDWESDEFCRKRVTECDLFICIVGHLYGSTPSHFDQSFTEREHQAAVDADMERIAFLAPEDFLLPINLREPDDKWQHQQQFRARVSQERLVDTFRSPDDLKARLIQAVRNWEQESRRIQTQEQKVDHEAVRQHLRSVVIHPYPLEANFTGRYKQRSQISKWLVGKAEPILAIIGIGGEGKSALTWAWLQYDFYGCQLPGSSPELYMLIRKPSHAVPEKLLWTQYGQSPLDSGKVQTVRPGDANVFAKIPVFWWSFYEPGAGFEAFIEQLIASMAARTPPNLTTVSEQVEYVLDELIRIPYLLILDGFERELMAYKRYERYRDEDLIRQMIVDYRCCALPEAGIFLRRLAASYSASKVIITSQLLPVELEGNDRRPLPGCRVMNLNGLDRDEALLFMRYQGVSGSETQIEEVCRLFDYHPLSLRIISGRILNNPRRPGNVTIIERNAALEMIGKEYRGVSVVYNDIPGNLRTFLGYLSGLDLPVDYQRLEEVAIGHGVFETGEELEGAIHLATELGLVRRDMETNQYSMHPVVRAYIRRKVEEKPESATVFRL